MKAKKVLSILLSTLVLLNFMSLAINAYDEKSKAIATIESANVGDTVYFGSYPQSAVNNVELIEKLNEINVPWKSYEYYEGTGSSGAYSPDGMSSMKPSNFMLYKDVYYNGDKYRGVRIDKYRPVPTRYYALGSYVSKDILEQTEQYRNGFELNTTYWFKYEPLAWEVLDPEEGLLLSTKIIDSQPYSNYQTKKDGLYYSDPNYENYLNSYYGSSIREWLNDDFATTAFSEGQISKLKEVELDNSDPTYDGIEYKPTVDKVYLLSYDDVTNPNYGFPTTLTGVYGSRMKFGTAYSKSQGLAYPYQKYYSEWWLRTPCNKAMNSSITGRDFVINQSGEIRYGWCSEFTYVGVVPAISVDTKLSMNCFYDQHEYGDFILNNDATCSDGTKYRICNLCGAKQTLNVEGSGSGHTYVSANNAIAPTCKVDGKESDIICSKCNFIYKQGEIIPTLEHNRIIMEGYSATCTKNGLTEGSKCSLCQLIFVKQNVIPATGHTYEVKTTTAPTHLTEGVKTYTCECGDSYTEAIAVIPHSYDEFITAPTCTEQGYTTYICECGDSYMADYTDTIDHKYTSEITTPATHLTEGVMTYTCDCGDIYTESIEKTSEHTYESVVTAPTCIEQGYTTYTCECGDIYSEVVEIDSDNHTGETVVRDYVATTCATDGYTGDTYCFDCETKIADGEVIPATGHNIVMVTGVEATCTEAGLTDGKYCSVCDEVFATQQIIEALGHDWKVITDTYKECKRCDETDGVLVYDTSVVLSQVTGRPGETVDVYVSFGKDTDVKTMSISDIVYDTSKLKLVKGEWLADGSVIDDWNLDAQVGVITFKKNTTLSGNVFVLTFEIKADLEDCETEIDCAFGIKAMNENNIETALAVEVIPGSVKITNIIKGDVNGDDYVDSNDAVHLLYHIMLPDRYEINQDCDFDGNGYVDSNDSIYLLYHTMLPDRYPLA